jgi:hypothetical protein
MCAKIKHALRVNAEARQSVNEVVEQRLLEEGMMRKAWGSAVAGAASCLAVEKVGRVRHSNRACRQSG